MKNDDACTRYNKARDRAKRREKMISNLQIVGFVILFIYVVWDCGHYEPEDYPERAAFSIDPKAGHIGGQQ